MKLFKLIFTFLLFLIVNVKGMNRAATLFYPLIRSSTSHGIKPCTLSPFSLSAIAFSKFSMPYMRSYCAHNKMVKQQNQLQPFTSPYNALTMPLRPKANNNHDQSSYSNEPKINYQNWLFGGLVTAAGVSSSHIIINGEKIEIYQHEKTETFEQKIDANGIFEIKKINGKVKVEGYNGDTIQVTARIKAHTKEDLDGVKITLNNNNDNKATLSTDTFNKEYIYIFGNAKSNDKKGLISSSTQVTIDGNNCSITTKKRSSWWPFFSYSDVSTKVNYDNGTNVIFDSSAVTNNGAVITIKPYIEYTIKIPKSTYITSHSSDEVNIDGCKGCNLTSDYNSAYVKDCNGFAKVKAYQKISIDQCNGADLASSYGTVEVRNCKGNADIKAYQKITGARISGKVTAKSEYNSIDLQSIGGDINAKAYQKVDIDGGNNIDVSTEYGNAHVRNIKGHARIRAYQTIKIDEAASVDARSSFGSIHVNNVTGKINAAYEYGQLFIDGILVTKKK